MQAFCPSALLLLLLGKLLQSSFTLNPFFPALYRWFFVKSSFSDLLNHSLFLNFANKSPYKPFRILILSVSNRNRRGLFALVRVPSIAVFPLTSYV